MKSTICKACNILGCGQVNIYSHPNKIDVIFNLLSQIEVKENDCLCMPCYDEMKIAYSFRQKCIQSELLRSNNLKNSAPKDNEISTIVAEFNVIEEKDESDSTENKEEASCSDRNLYIVTENEKPLKIKSKMKVEDKKGRYSCDICDRSFYREKTLKKHIDSHKSEDKGEGKNKRKKEPTFKIADEDIFQGLHDLQCGYCFAEFKDRDEKDSHSLKHETEEKPYQCTFGDCTSRFKDKYGLRNHVRIHSDIKRYKCKYCEHRFHQRGNIISHERLHTGEKPFLCTHCGKAFAESGNLKAHIRFHTGERPYSCSECPKKFKTHYSHKVHFRSHTKERPYLCSECGKSFSSSGKLLVHKRTHSGHRPYLCTVCPGAFVDSSGLKRHSKIHL